MTNNTTDTYSYSNANITQISGTTNNLIQLGGTTGSLEIKSGYLGCRQRCINSLGKFSMSGGTIASTGSTSSVVTLDNRTTTASTISGGTIWNSYNTTTADLSSSSASVAGSALYVPSTNTAALNISGSSYGGTRFYSKSGNGVSIASNVTVTITRGIFVSYKARGLQVSKGTVNINRSALVTASNGAYFASIQRSGLYAFSGTTAVNLGYPIDRGSTTQYAPTFVTGTSGMYALTGNSTTKIINLYGGSFFCQNSDNSENWDNTYVNMKCSGSSCAEVKGSSSSTYTAGISDLDSSWSITLKWHKYATKK